MPRRVQLHPILGVFMVGRRPSQRNADQDAAIGNDSIAHLRQCLERIRHVLEGVVSHEQSESFWNAGQAASAKPDTVDVCVCRHEWVESPNIAESESSKLQWQPPGAGANI